MSPDEVCRDIVRIASSSVSASIICGTKQKYSTSHIGQYRRRWQLYREDGRNIFNYVNSCSHLASRNSSGCLIFVGLFSLKIQKKYIPKLLLKIFNQNDHNSAAQVSVRSTGSTTAAPWTSSGRRWPRRRCRARWAVIGRELHNTDMWLVESSTLQYWSVIGPGRARGVRVWANGGWGGGGGGVQAGVGSQQPHPRHQLQVGDVV